MRRKAVMLGAAGDQCAVASEFGETLEVATGQAPRTSVTCGRAPVLGVAAPALVALSWLAAAFGASQRSRWQLLRASPLEIMDNAMLSLALAGSPNATVAKANTQAAATAQSHRMLTLTFAAAFVAGVAMVVVLLSVSRIARKPALRAR